MIIGLLCGREYSFPPAFIERVNELGSREAVEHIHRVLAEGTSAD